VPAQRKKSRRLKSPKRKIFLYFLFSLILIFFPSFVFLQKRVWNGKDKLSVVINNPSGDILISTFDPNTKEIINLNISGELEVELARRLGIWKLKSVWKLAENENIEGKLLTETITKYLKLPVFLWADFPAGGFSKGGLGLIKAVFLPYETNLKMSDRLGIGLFSLRVNNKNKVDIDLAKSGFLEEATLTDGSSGYRLLRKLPDFIQAGFSDNQLSREKAKMIIKDRSGFNNSASELGEVVEVLGAKMASIVKEEEEDSDCLVKSKDRRLGRKIAWIFSCQLDEKDLEGNFNFEVILGKRFAQRF